MAAAKASQPSAGPASMLPPLPCLMTQIACPSLPGSWLYGACALFGVRGFSCADKPSHIRAACADHSRRAIANRIQIELAGSLGGEQMLRKVKRPKAPRLPRSTMLSRVSCSW